MRFDERDSELIEVLDDTARKLTPGGRPFDAIAASRECDEMCFNGVLQGDTLVFSAATDDGRDEVFDSDEGADGVVDYEANICWEELLCDEAVEDVLDDEALGELYFAGGDHIEDGNEDNEAVANAVVVKVFETLLESLEEHLLAGKRIHVPRLGTFYVQRHKGHTVQFGGDVLEPYVVLKFKADRGTNKRYRDLDEKKRIPVEVSPGRR